MFCVSFYASKFGNKYQSLETNIFHDVVRSYLKYIAMCKICKNTGFLWPVHSRMNTESTIMSFYGNMQVGKNWYSGIFYEVIRANMNLQTSSNSVKFCYLFMAGIFRVRWCIKIPEMFGTKYYLNGEKIGHSNFELKQVGSWRLQEGSVHFHSTLVFQMHHKNLQLLL